MTQLEDVGKTPGGDTLRGFLAVSHNDDGTLKSGSGGAVPTRQIFTSSGTYTLPTSCKAILVECIGGGGEGGGTPATAASGNGQCAAGAGGGGGAYSASLITSPAASYSVTVGAGGSTGTAGQAGQAGGDTVFGTNVVVAKGGAGGSLGGVDIGTFPDVSGAAVAGGHVASGIGDFLLEGGSSSGGMMLRVGLPMAGQGGTAPCGAGTKLAAPNNGTNPGASGLQYGGGGSGATATTSAAAQKGGNGAGGVCIVTEYY